MLVMVVFFIAFRWIHLSTPLIRLFLLVLILLLMPTLNFLPVWFALSLLRFRLPSRLPMSVVAGDSFEMDAVGALRLSPLRRGLAIDSTVDIFTFYVPHRHVYGEQWIKFMKDGVNATPLPTVNTTGYIDHAAFLGTINPDTNKIPKHLFQGYLNIYNNYF